MTENVESPLRVLFVDIPAQLTDTAAELAGHARIEAVGAANDVAEALTMLAAARPDAIIVGAAPGEDPIGPYEVAAMHEHSQAPVLMLVEKTDGAIVAAALRSGLADVLVGGTDLDSKLFAIDKAIRLSRRIAQAREAEPARNGRVVSFYSAKGGVGTTSLAINVAAAAAARGVRTLIVDLDPYSGDVALSLGVSPAHTMVDLFMTGGALDAATIRHFVAEHSTGLDVLAAPVSMQDAQMVSTSRVIDLLTTARTAYDLVVIDTSSELSELALAAFDQCDRLALVSSTDVASARATNSVLRMLETLAFPTDRVTHVLNRAGARVRLDEIAMYKLLGSSIAASVPSSRLLPEALNCGVPLVLGDPRSAPARAMGELLTALVPSIDRNDASARRSLRSLLGAASTN